VTCHFEDDRIDPMFECLETPAHILKIDEPQ